MCVIIDEFMNAYMLVIPQANKSVIYAISHIGSQIRTSAALWAGLRNCGATIKIATYDPNIGFYY